jgi:hypothetical protein
MQATSASLLPARRHLVAHRYPFPSSARRRLRALHLTRNRLASDDERRATQNLKYRHIKLSTENILTNYFRT